MSEHKQQTTELVLIRHGQSDWNIVRRCQGTLDESRLTPTGVEQATEVSRALTHTSLAAIYSSSQQRSVQTAQIIAEPHKLKVNLDSRLKEMYQGVWEGMLYPDIESQYGELYGRFMKNPVGNVPPGGESIETLNKRVLKAIDEIAARHPGQKVAIVSHELPLAAIRCHADGKDLSALWQYGPANTEIVHLNWNIERQSWREILWSWMTMRWWFAND